jgi:hypothetical protein
MVNKIFADFNNADKKIELNEGLEVLLDDDDGLVASGAVHFSKEENIWVAILMIKEPKH